VAIGVIAKTSESGIIIAGGKAGGVAAS